jgi:hypothetical protein
VLCICRASAVPAQQKNMASAQGSCDFGDRVRKRLCEFREATVEKYSMFVETVAPMNVQV